MKKALPILYILIAAVLWGCIGLFYKQLTAIGFTPMQVVLLRVSVAAVTMAIYIAVKNPHLFRIRIRDVWVFIGTGVVSLAFFNFCYFRSMDESSVSVAATLLYTAPVFVTLFSAVLFKEKLTVRTVISLILTVLGCVLVTEIFNDNALSLTGVLYGLGSGIGYALYSVFGVYALRRYKTETVTFYTFVFAAVSVLPLCGVWNIPSVMAVSPLTAVFNSLAIGILACVLPYWFYTKGLQGIKAGHASMIATLEPVVAAIIGVTVFSDAITIYKVIGMMLIIGGICVLSIRKTDAVDKR